MAVRAPYLHQVLRCFCLAAFNELERGTALVPRVRGHVETDDERLARLPDARIALEELARDPATAIYADELFPALVMPLLDETADACVGFDWDENAFARAYAQFELRLYGDGHAYSAVAPLFGLSTPVRFELGSGVVVRQRAEGELESEPECVYVIAIERDLPAGEADLPDAPGELADAITALRLATGAPVAAGPLVFDRLDHRPRGARAAQPYAAMHPAGEPSRLDEFRARLARDLCERLALAEADPELGEAIDRWELSLFQDGAERDDSRRQSLATLLAGEDGPFAASLRAAVLLGETGEERADLLDRLRESAPDAELLRRALVEVLMHGERGHLLERLDESLLGLLPAPPSYYAVRAAG